MLWIWGVEVAIPNQNIFRSISALEIASQAIFSSHLEEICLDP